VIQVIKKQNYQGIIAIPPSKSDSQRAILCAGLAFGISVLSNVGKSDDEKVMISTIRSLGARIHFKDEKTLEIKGVGGLQLNSIKKIELGESGLGARLLISIAATSTQSIELNGEGSLLDRDMSFFENYLPKMGVEITSNNFKLPIIVKGPIKGGNYSVDGGQSSQYISGLLMALPFANEATVLKVTDLKSRPYVYMTLGTLKHFGIDVRELGDHYFIRENQQFSGKDYTIDGDWSSASYWLVASALGIDVSVKGLSMNSLQADKSILQAFLSANCEIINSKEGIRIKGKNRVPFSFDATDCPDLFPALVVLACFTKGKSVLKGVNRLANKESHRANTLKQEFEKLGFKIELIDNEMLIHGGGDVKGCRCGSHHDHRIAMCLAIVGMFSDEGIEIEDSEVVTKSYPGFWEDLRLLG